MGWLEPAVGRLNHLYAALILGCTAKTLRGHVCGYPPFFPLLAVIALARWFVTFRVLCKNHEEDGLLVLGLAAGAGCYASMTCWRGCV
jgi:hypothetical protein